MGVVPHLAKGLKESVIRTFLYREVHINRLKRKGRGNSTAHSLAPETTGARSWGLQSGKHDLLIPRSHLKASDSKSD